MRDPWNPTSAEITTWAYEPASMWPGQDWDLAVTDDHNAHLLLKLASDPACPKREFFLRCLELLDAGPGAVDYDLWCDGGYSRAERLPRG